MLLSNQPAEELARILIDGSNGAFELCGFVSGGWFKFQLPCNLNSYLWD